MRLKRSALITLFLLLLLAGVCGLWVRGQQRQYVRNRQLIEALVHNDGKKALALVNAGADPNTWFKPTPLPSLMELVKQLFHRSPPPAVNDSPTAFMIACGDPVSTDEGGMTSYGPDDAPLVKAMLTHGAFVNEREALSEGGWTALIYAAVTKRQNTAGVLIAHGADVNAKNGHGQTPLIFAAANATPSTVHILLEHGAMISPKDENGKTVMDYARDNLKVDPSDSDARNITAILRLYGAK